MIPQVQDQADFRVMKMFILTYQFHFSIDILSKVLLAIERHVIDLINADILAVILSSKSFCIILLISMGVRDSQPNGLLFCTTRFHVSVVSPIKTVNDFKGVSSILFSR